MRNCLVVCATKQRSACEVAAHIANELRLRDVAVDLECSSDISDIGDYDAVIIGARLCHGRWKRSTKRFLRQHREKLLARDVALFIPAPCAAGEKAYNRSWKRLIRMMRRIEWLNPVRIELFSDRELPGEISCCPQGEQSKIAQWCRSLTASMGMSDRQTPNQPGIT